MIHCTYCDGNHVEANCPNACKPQQTEPVQVLKVDSDLALKLAEMFTHDPVWVADIEPLLAAHRVAAERAAILRVAKLVEPPASASDTPERRIRSILAKEILYLIPAAPAAQTGEK